MQALTTILLLLLKLLPSKMHPKPTDDKHLSQHSPTCDATCTTRQARA